MSSVNFEKLDALFMKTIGVDTRPQEPVKEAVPSRQAPDTYLTLIDQVLGEVELVPLPQAS